MGLQLARWGSNGCVHGGPSGCTAAPTPARRHSTALAGSCYMVLPQCADLSGWQHWGWLRVRMAQETAPAAAARGAGAGPKRPSHTAASAEWRQLRRQVGTPGLWLPLEGGAVSLGFLGAALLNAPFLGSSCSREQGISGAVGAWPGPWAPSAVMHTQTSSLGMDFNFVRTHRGLGHPPACRGGTFWTGVHLPLLLTLR